MVDVLNKGVLVLIAGGVLMSAGAGVLRASMSPGEIPGQYCTDKTGGQIYFPTGAPIPDSVRCGAQSGAAPSAASPTAAATTSAPAASTASATATAPRTP